MTRHIFSFQLVLILRQALITYTSRFRKQNWRRKIWFYQRIKCACVCVCVCVKVRACLYCMFVCVWFIWWFPFAFSNRCPFCSIELFLLSWGALRLQYRDSTHILQSCMECWWIYTLAWEAILQFSFYLSFLRQPTLKCKKLIFLWAYYFIEELAQLLKKSSTPKVVTVSHKIFSFVIFVEKKLRMCILSSLTLLHSERPKLYNILAFLCAVWLVLYNCGLSVCSRVNIIQLWPFWVQ